MMNEHIDYIEKHSTYALNTKEKHQQEIVALLLACMRAKNALTMSSLDKTTRDLVIENLGEAIAKHQEIVTFCKKCGRCWIAKDKGTRVENCTYCEDVS